MRKGRVDGGGLRGALQSHPRSRGERVTQERRDQKGTEVNEERLNRESGCDGARSLPSPHHPRRLWAPPLRVSLTPFPYHSRRSPTPGFPSGRGADHPGVPAARRERMNREGQPNDTRKRGTEPR